MEASYGRGEVRLSDDDAERARSAEAAVSESLNAMAGLIVETMEGPGDRDLKLKRASADLGVHVLIVHGPDYCYVYDGDAGVCRPCTPEEEAG